MEKRCPGCQERKQLAVHTRNRAARDGHCGYSRPCHNARGAPAPERNGGARNHDRMRQYGITADQLDAMMKEQGAWVRCARRASPTTRTTTT